MWLPWILPLCLSVGVAWANDDPTPPVLERHRLKPEFDKYWKECAIWLYDTFVISLDDTTPGKEDIICWDNMNEKNIFDFVVTSIEVWGARIPGNLYEPLQNTRSPGNVRSEYWYKVNIDPYLWVTEIDIPGGRSLPHRPLSELPEDSRRHFIRSILMSPLQQESIGIDRSGARRGGMSKPTYVGLLEALDMENFDCLFSISNTENVDQPNYISLDPKSSKYIPLNSYWTGAQPGGKVMLRRYYSTGLSLGTGGGQVVRIMYQSEQDDYTKLALHCEIGNGWFKCRDLNSNIVRLPGTWWNKDHLG